jgi:hypothetical protein
MQEEVMETLLQYLVTPQQGEALVAVGIIL